VLKEDLLHISHVIIPSLSDSNEERQRDMRNISRHNATQSTTIDLCSKLHRRMTIRTYFVRNGQGYVNE
jgi:hypothetical protein